LSTIPQTGKNDSGIEPRGRQRAGRKAEEGSPHSFQDRQHGLVADEVVLFLCVVGQVTTLALAARPDRDDLPRDPATLDQPDRTVDQAGRTLAEALAAD
jgi:hypothetical protein